MMFMGVNMIVLSAIAFIIFMVIGLFCFGLVLFIACPNIVINFIGDDKDEYLFELDKVGLINKGVISAILAVISIAGLFCFYACYGIIFSLTN